jgi:hypothetical protein
MLGIELPLQFIAVAQAGEEREIPIQNVCRSEFAINP